MIESRVFSVKYALTGSEVVIDNEIVGHVGYGVATEERKNGSKGIKHVKVPQQKEVDD